MQQIVILSGRVAVGKTTVAELLESRFGFQVLRTRDLIAAAQGTQPERSALQVDGDRLDRKTGGRWVANAIPKLLAGHDCDRVVVDSVRKKIQIDAVRSGFGASVVHVHLLATVETIGARYLGRKSSLRELPTYDAVAKSATERGVDGLRHHADIVVDTDRTGPEGVLCRVAGRLGLFGRGIDRLVDVVVGGQYGSEGKGNIAAHLAPEYDILVRVGGPNAGHTVFSRPSPEKYHHLPSGTRRCFGLKVLGPGAVLDAELLLSEIRDADEFASVSRLAIDPQSMIIEAQDGALERKKLKSTIGSTASGTGCATARKVLRRAADPTVRLARDVKELRPFIRDTVGLLEVAFSEGKRVLLEGTQGTGLSLHHGDYPYVTSRETTAGGCLAEAGIAPSRVRRVVMVCRTYPIRVESPKRRATSGPMRAQEIAWDLVAERSGVDLDEILRTEVTTRTNRKRRVSEFSWEAVRRAATLNAPTDVALTFADYLSAKNQRARRFEQLTEDTQRFIEELEWVTGAPVSLITARFHYRGIIDRRRWGAV